MCFVLWLFLAIVKFCMACLDSVVLAHPFWTLAALPVCSFVLSWWTNRTPSVSLSLSFFTFVWEAGCVQGTPIALSVLQYVCWRSHYQPSFICVVILFLLPEKADTYFYNSSFSLLSIGIFQRPQYRCIYTNNSDQTEE